MWAGVQVPGSQDGGDVRAEGHPQPEAIPQAGSGGNQDPRAPAQPGHSLTYWTFVLLCMCCAVQVACYPCQHASPLSCCFGTAWKYRNRVLLLACFSDIAGLASLKQATGSQNALSFILISCKPDKRVRMHACMAIAVYSHWCEYRTVVSVYTCVPHQVTCTMVVMFGPQEVVSWWLKCDVGHAGQ